MDASPSPVLQQLPEFAPGGRVRHGFSTRTGGEAPPGLAPAQGHGPAPFLARGPWPGGAAFVRLRQVHGSRVATLEKAPRQAPEADGCTTRAAGLVLLIRTADCVPLLLADEEAGVVGAAHGGWRGLLAGVVEATIDAMAALGARPARIQAAIGPHIGACCFEVGPEVAQPFRERAAPLVVPGPRRPHVDLAAATEDLLAGAGVKTVHRLPEACTACSQDRFWSYRRQGTQAGRLLSGIALA